MIKSVILCLALNVYYEARGEPILGQIAVAHVTMNRARNNHTSVCKEVFKKDQFSWTRRRWVIPSNNDKIWIQSKNIAKKSLQMKDITFNSMHFHAIRCKECSIN